MENGEWSTETSDLKRISILNVLGFDNHLLFTVYSLHHLRVMSVDDDDEDEDDDDNLFHWKFIRLRLICFRRLVWMTSLCLKPN